MKIALSAILFALTAFTASSQNVGIGTTTPQYPLTVNAVGVRGITQIKGLVELGFYTSEESAYLQTWSPHSLNFAVSNGNPKITILHPSGNVGIATAQPTAQLDVNGSLRIRGNGAAAGKLLTTDAEGNATWTGPVFVRAITSSYITNINTTRTPIRFDFKQESQNGLFDLATTSFTAPVAGFYQVSAAIWGTCNSAVTLYLDRNGSTALAATFPGSTIVKTASVSGLVEMKVGDKLVFSADVSSGTGIANPAPSATYFNISLVR